MKSKKFKFKQTVWSLVKTEYTYKVEAKSYEKAEEELKELFAKKLEKGKEFSPLKKLNPKDDVVECDGIQPEMMGKATVVVEYISKSKKNEIAVELFNNKEKQWKPNVLNIHDGDDTSDSKSDSAVEEDKEE